MTFLEKFDKLAKKLIKADTSKYAENFAVQITMDDEDCGGTFYVSYIDGVYKVEPYDYVDNTVNINIMASTLEKLIDKKVSVDEAFEVDAVAANGNADHLVMLFDGFVKKAPAKKAAAKNPAAKKETVKKPAEKKETKKAEPKKEEVKKAEVKKEEPKKAEAKAEVKKEEAKKPAARKEPAKKTETKKK